MRHKAEGHERRHTVLRADTLSCKENATRSGGAKTARSPISARSCRPPRTPSRVGQGAGSAAVRHTARMREVRGERDRRGRGHQRNANTALQAELAKMCQDAAAPLITEQPVERGKEQRRDARKSKQARRRQSVHHEATHFSYDSLSCHKRQTGCKQSRRLCGRMTYSRGAASSATNQRRQKASPM